MAENIDLNKSVFNKRDYNKTIDTSFTQLGVKSIQQQLDEQPTIQEFFSMYNTLFYQINEFGPTNSHEYLIKTSSEYINFEENDEIIQALQNEIAQLREELLETQQIVAGIENPPELLDSTTEIPTTISSGGATGGATGGSSGGGY
jgi:hypothetical protein|tara:strand:+ start:1171 stop:1608 length:438 start_codon:yes stop_codon:yes gene_type:complete